MEDSFPDDPTNDAHANEEFEYLESSKFTPSGMGTKRVLSELDLEILALAGSSGTESDSEVGPSESNNDETEIEERAAGDEQTGDDDRTVVDLAGYSSESSGEVVALAAAKTCCLQSRERAPSPKDAGNQSWNPYSASKLNPSTLNTQAPTYSASKSNTSAINTPAPNVPSDNVAANIHQQQPKRKYSSLAEQNRTTTLIEHSPPPPQIKYGRPMNQQKFDGKTPNFATQTATNLVENGPKQLCPAGNNSLSTAIKAVCAVPGSTVKGTSESVSGQQPTSNKPAPASQPSIARYQPPSSRQYSDPTKALIERARYISTSSPYNVTGVQPPPSNQQSASTKPVIHPPQYNSIPVQNNISQFQPPPSRQYSESTRFLIERARCVSTPIQNNITQVEPPPSNQLPQSAQPLLNQPQHTRPTIQTAHIHPGNPAYYYYPPVNIEPEYRLAEAQRINNWILYRSLYAPPSPPPAPPRDSLHRLPAAAAEEKAGNHRTKRKRDASYSSCDADSPPGKKPAPSS